MALEKLLSKLPLLKILVIDFGDSKVATNKGFEAIIRGIYTQPTLVTLELVCGKL